MVTWVSGVPHGVLLQERTGRSACDAALVLAALLVNDSLVLLKLLVTHAIKRILSIGGLEDCGVVLEVPLYDSLACSAHLHVVAPLLSKAAGGYNMKVGAASKGIIQRDFQ